MLCVVLAFIDVYGVMRLPVRTWHWTRQGSAPLLLTQVHPAFHLQQGFQLMHCMSPR